LDISVALAVLVGKVGVIEALSVRATGFVMFIMRSFCSMKKAAIPHKAATNIIFGKLLKSFCKPSYLEYYSCCVDNPRVLTLHMSAFYRKYRPRTLSQLLGQEDNVRVLQNAAKTGRLAHAYLLYGSRGSGKTTTARLLAKLYNCEKRLSEKEFALLGEPCNECSSCRQIDEGNAMDVIEIDAASNRGIDEIRALKENIRVAPVVARYKIYIIDEAHMLTGAASNALLKTLEEPPAHGVIILATTEYDKIPATISSRAQRFFFSRLSKKTIIDKLKTIAEQENIKAEEGALDVIASASEGSLRDAESLFDQLSGMSNEIKTEDASRALGRTSFQKVAKMAELIGEKDLSNALAYLEEISREGVNFADFTKELIHHFRKALTLRVAPDAKALIAEDHTPEELSALEKLAGKMREDEFVRLLRGSIRAMSEMRYSPYGAVPLQVVLVEQLS